MRDIIVQVHVCVRMLMHGAVACLLVAAAAAAFVTAELWLMHDESQK